MQPAINTTLILEGRRWGGRERASDSEVGTKKEWEGGKETVEKKGDEGEGKET